jgi:hypothetical protein
MVTVGYTFCNLFFGDAKMNKKTIKHDYPMVHVRMPEELKEMLTVAAKENARTVTTEIIYRLERSFKSNNSPFTISMSISEQLADLAEKVSELERNK